jgi:hypothetical protein
MFKIFCFLIFWANCLYFHSQNTNSSSISDTLHLQGFFDVYYVYDFHCGEEGQKRQSFFYNYNRHRELNLNIGVLKATWKHRQWITDMGLHSGTYVTDNYASENEILRHFSELSISRRFYNYFIIRAGIMPSHIGFEGTMPFEQITLTRTLMAENSPYYMTGISFSKKFFKTLECQFLALTGWQRILPLPGRKIPALGFRWWYSNPEGWSANLSAYVDPLNSDTVHNGRKFINSYLIYNHKLFCLIAGLDAGLQPELISKNNKKSWHAASFLFQYRFHKFWKSSLKWEYYSDRSLVIISSPLPFFTHGFSGNVDLQIRDLLFRIEIRYLLSDNPAFACKGNYSRQNLTLAFSFSYRFLSTLYR